MMDMTQEIKKENDIVIFLFGPFLFLILVKFTGYQIFYDRGSFG
jgi:hypothetical protein